jgi:hypothetical protein
MKIGLLVMALALAFGAPLQVAAQSSPQTDILTQYAAAYAPRQASDSVADNVHNT